MDITHIHNWIHRKGSDEILCLYCYFCPILENRYKCNICKKEACRFCLTEKGELPLTSVFRNIPRIEETSETSKVQRNRITNLEERVALLEIRLIT